jgi:anti-sigma-K factor RskA
MNISEHRLFDALCGEYILGALRGSARSRFERVVRTNPAAAARLRRWEAIVPRYSNMIEITPPARVWQRLKRELGLRRYRIPWHERAGFWRASALAASFAFLLLLAAPRIAPLIGPPAANEIAELTSEPGGARVSARLSSDRQTLTLSASRPVIAGPAQSYELWLIPETGAPLALAVLGSLDVRFEVPEGRRALLRSGARLAISVEPAGGSPKPGPTGPVILVGTIRR